MNPSASWQTRVDCGREVGAGLLVSARHVVTCAHVVQDSGSAPVTVTFPGAAGLGANVATVVADGGWRPRGRAEGDLAVLELDREVPLRTAEFAPPGAGYGDPPGRLLVYGFPAGYDEGTLAEYRTTGSQLIAGEWIQLEAWNAHGQPLAPGFSGAAAVLADTGQVVGMVSAAAAEHGVRNGRMLPAAVMARYWPRLGELIPTHGFGHAAKRGLRRLVEAAQRSAVDCTPAQLYTESVDPLRDPPLPPGGFASFWAAAWFLLWEVDDVEAPARFALRLADFVEDPELRHRLRRWPATHGPGWGPAPLDSPPGAGPPGHPLPARRNEGAAGPHPRDDTRHADRPRDPLGPGSRGGAVGDPSAPVSWPAPASRPGAAGRAPRTDHARAADAARHGPAAPAEEAPAADDAAGAGPTGWSPIVVEMERSGAGRGQLLVQVSAYHDGRRRMIGSRTLTRARLRGYVAERVDEAFHELPHGAQVLIAFVLTRELLNEPVSDWPRGTDDPSPLGCLYPLVVMDRERRRKGSLQHGLLRKWHSLPGDTPAQLYRVECGSSEDQGKLTVRLWEDGQMMALTAPPNTARVKKLFTAGLNGSVPVMMWPRTGCPGGHPAGGACPGGEFLDSLVAYLNRLSPAELPSRIRELRKSVYLSAAADEHWARDLTLLWEDPRCFPQTPGHARSPVA